MKRRRDDRALMWRPPPSSSSCDLCCAVVQSTLGLLTWPWGMAVWPLVAPPFFFYLGLASYFWKARLLPSRPTTKKPFISASFVLVVLLRPAAGGLPPAPPGCGFVCLCGGTGPRARVSGRPPASSLPLSAIGHRQRQHRTHRQGWSARPAGRLAHHRRDDGGGIGPSVWTVPRRSRVPR